MAHPYSAVLPAARLFYNRKKPACPEYGSGRAGNGGTCKKCSLQSRRKEICSHERAGSPELQGNGICLLVWRNKTPPQDFFRRIYQSPDLPDGGPQDTPDAMQSKGYLSENREIRHCEDQQPRTISQQSSEAAAHRINLNGRGIGKVRLEVVSVGDGNYEIFAR